MAGTSENDIPVTSKAQLVESVEAGCKSPDNLRIGTEHEKIVFENDTLKRPAYEGTRGIGALLSHIADEFDWEPITEKDKIIGIMDSHGGSITLEPGGQFELSGAPVEDLHQTCDETARHLADVRPATDALDLGMVGIGFDPKWGNNEIPWMPKGRYDIMREYIPQQGLYGLDIMLRTCTTQTNLDYVSEDDMVRKFRTSLILQPIATAIFANSPFRDGKPSGLFSTRAEAWTDFDPVRCGFPDCVFDSGFCFEMWVDYLLDLPMFMIEREGHYIDVAGQSFREFMEGRLPGFEGQLPTMNDWLTHATTAFPEVRLKTFLEMRGADCGPWDMICALPALWVGLLYDEDALTAAEELAGNINVKLLEHMREDIARYALNAQLGEVQVLSVARRMVEIAHDGLARRSRLNAAGDDETGFLDTLRDIVESGETRSEVLLEMYQGRWDGKIEPLYRDFAF